MRRTLQKLLVTLAVLALVLGGGPIVSRPDWASARAVSATRPRPSRSEPTRRDVTLTLPDPVAGEGSPRGGVVRAAESSIGRDRPEQGTMGRSLQSTRTSPKASSADGTTGVRTTSRRSGTPSTSARWASPRCGSYLGRTEGQPATVSSGSPRKGCPVAVHIMQAREGGCSAPRAIGRRWRLRARAWSHRQHEGPAEPRAMGGAFSLPLQGPVLGDADSRRT